MPVAAEQPLGKVAYEVTDSRASDAMLVMCQIGVQHVKDRMRQRGVSPEILLVVVATLITALGLSFTVEGDPLFVWGLRALASVVLLFVLYKAGLYFYPPMLRWYARRQSTRLVRALRDRHIEWTFYDDRLETHSSIKSRAIPWSQLRLVVIHPENWFLVFHQQLILFVPARFLPMEMQALLRRKAEECGAEIRDRTSFATDTPDS